MSGRIAVKIFIDAMMLVLYLQLTFLYIHNTIYHEIMGILVGVVFVVHILLNIREAKSLIKRKRALPLVLDGLLVISMVACIATGLLVAKDLFVGPGDATVAWVHTIAAYVGLGAIAAHLLLHASYFAGVVSGVRKTSDQVSQEAPASDVATPCTRRDFAKKAALAGIGVFSVASFIALEAPLLSKLSREEDEPVATYSRKGTSYDDSYGLDDPSGESPADDASQSGLSSSNSSDSVAETDVSSDASSNICTLCRKNCPVSDLQCQKGVAWATENGYL